MSSGGEIQPSPGDRCVITRFNANPKSFLVGAFYGCDVPCKGMGGRLTQNCGRTLVPEIAESGERGFVITPNSPRCAVAAGTVVVIDTINPSDSPYL